MERDLEFRQWKFGGRDIVVEDGKVFMLIYIVLVLCTAWSAIVNLVCFAVPS